MKIEARSGATMFLVRLGEGPESLGRIVHDDTGHVSKARLFGSLLSHGQWEWLDENALDPAKRDLILARIRVTEEEEKQDRV